MELSEIDLNLLVVLHQLLRERNVSRVAASLGQSQPAVSNALRRLRECLGDELFLRKPHGMEPTPYAQQLAEPVAQALGTLREALNVRASFDPAHGQRCFTLALSDVGEIYFLPVLMDALAAEAPCPMQADMQAMLQNIPQGILTIVDGNKVHPEYSAFLETVFETTDIAGRDVMELVFSNTNLGADTLSQIEAIGGQIAVESQEGVGSTFKVFLKNQ